jgi:nicotinamidase-related amidase
MTSRTDFTLDVPRAAVVVTDPQIDFLSPRGAAWDAVGPSVERNHTVENIERLLRAARRANMLVAISPHYYYASDHPWGFGGPLEALMDRIRLNGRGATVALDRPDGGGAAFMPQFRPYLVAGKTVVASAHRACGPDHDDLGRLLRGHGIEQVILAGMLANLCVESHLRMLREWGFEVAAVKDATAAAILPDGDGYLAALINFRYLANALWTTDEAVERM